jgi:glutamyl-tRNA reductase
MNELLALGISHKTAPVALRERLAFSEAAAADFAAEALDDDVHEVVAISTCNRTEVYAVVGEPVAAETRLLAMLARRAGIRPTELAEVIYSPRNCDAARQLFRVSAGLESMIVGEAEVQGQVSRAYQAALDAGTTGPLTNRLFSAALTTGKRVRAETRIGARRVSVPSVAVGLAREVIGDLSGRHVVLIGAGETSELTGRALAAHGVRTMIVANRRADRARSVAERFGGQVVGLEDLPRQLALADIVVASTASPHAILERDDLELVLEAREGRPLVLIDIAVPRDVDPACAELPGVTLYDMDDLQKTLARNLQHRASDVPPAEAIVEEEIQRFARWLGQLDTRPTIAALRAHAAAIVDQVIAENASRWESASERDLVRVEAVVRAAVSRLLHEPTTRLRSLSGDRSHGSLQLVRELFDLEPEATAGPASVPTEAEPAEVRPLTRRAGRTGRSVKAE